MREGKAGRLFIARFTHGLGCLFRAFALVFSNGRIFMLSLVPFLLGLIIYCAFFIAVIFLTDDVADLVLEPGAWWRTALRALMIVALPLLFIVLSIFTYALACLALAAPFYEVLSAAVERRIAGGVEEEPFSVKNVAVDIGRGVRSAIVLLLIEVCVLIFGLLLVPVTTVLALMATAVLLSLEFLDYPMARRRIALGKRLAFARRYVWELIGLGLPMVFFLGIPFLGAAFLPMGVVGGTLLFLDLAGGRTPGLKPR